MSLSDSSLEGKVGSVLHTTASVKAADSAIPQTGAVAWSSSDASVATVDENGNITEIHCTYDPQSKGGNSPDGRKVKGTIQWVSAEKNVKAEIRLYENIVDEEKGVYNEDGSLNLNPNSLTVLKDCYVEENLADAKAYDSFQFVRQGFFCVDAKDSTPEHLVFNRIVSLKSSFKLPSNN